MEERKEEEEKEVSGRRLGREERGRFRERGVGRERYERPIFAGYLEVYFEDAFN